jgi:hypothetical protein
MGTGTGQVVHSNSAPTGGMQVVNSWTLNEFVPILVNSTTYDIDSPAQVQFVAGPNGWVYSVDQGGVRLVQEEGAYGENTG